MRQTLKVTSRMFHVMRCMPTDKGKGKIYGCKRFVTDTYKA